ncbi:MAG: hypothetical protein CBB71_03620 [Rhodopirellula sp. TMED11]|nr:MAG: hypothetical protein CBB71_03620 [Rhodopirellula sp. TMED11]
MRSARERRKGVDGQLGLACTPKKPELFGLIAIIISTQLWTVAGSVQTGRLRQALGLGFVAGLC